MNGKVLSVKSVLSPVGKANSCHVISRTSLVRAPVSIINCRAFMPMPSRLARSAHQRATSYCCNAGCFSFFATLLGLGSSSARLPFQRAGLSPSRKPETVAQERTASIRWRSLVAEAFLVSQIGSSIRKISRCVISSTLISPKFGRT